MRIVKMKNINGEEYDSYVSDDPSEKSRVLLALFMADMVDPEKLAELADIPLGLAQEFRKLNPPKKT